MVLYRHEQIQSGSQIHPTWLKCILSFCGQTASTKVNTIEMAFIVST